GYASITTKNQTNLTLNTTWWLPGNSVHISGSVSHLNFPFNFYGIGNATSQASQDRLGEYRFKLNFDAEKKAGDNLFMGIVGGAFDYSFGDPNPNSIYNTDPDLQGKAGGPGVYLGPSIIFDSRNNNTYTTKGMIVTAYLNITQGIFSNNN